ncbi:Saccharopine dehydrogenase [hydrothermal vent metagenome]|uniref:Saccharopine dehydrogenase n=1 Tax=hydrothermal vent metagenome TaxID=652676 RepID=A0A3B0RG23_9ZZZZ
MMAGPVLILGGYGNFGARIAEQLCKADIPVIIAGRNPDKAEKLSQQLGALATASSFDANKDLAARLSGLKPDVVINTCGPFQFADYAVAETCIDHKIHYIDLADGRKFVAGFDSLDKRAKKAGVAAITGASSVPGLSSAVIEHFRDEFALIDQLKYGISPGQKTERGLATTQSILSYVGKPMQSFPGQTETAYGWQDIYRQKFPGIGKRWMANCEIPDLDILPTKYGIRKIQFSAGLELGVLHLGLWLLSWAIRAGAPVNLAGQAKTLLTASNFFNWFGSDTGAMHMVLSGKDHQGAEIIRGWCIIARKGSGPYIPTIPAVLLAKSIVSQNPPAAGAYPCVGLISLGQYLHALKDYPVETFNAG